MLPTVPHFDHKKGLGVSYPSPFEFLARQGGIEPTTDCLEAFPRDKDKHHRSNNFRGVSPFTPPLPLSYYRVIEVGSDRSILRKFEKTSAMSGSGMIYI